MLLNKCCRRGFAAAATAHAKPNPLLEPVQQNTSTTPSGLTVSSVDLQGAVTQFVFAFRSGSRYEQHDEMGLTHVLRNAIGKDSMNYLGVKLLWQTGQTGSSLKAKLSKDVFAVQMSVNRTMAPIALSILGEFIQPACKPWDILDVQQEVETDLNSQSVYDIVLENLHRAAYRNGGLANPLLAPKYQIGKIEYEKLKMFVNSRWKSRETALVGINVDHSLMLDYTLGQSLVPEGKASPAEPSPYKGGDFHQNGPGGLAHVMVAGQGAKLSDEKAVAVQAVLVAAIGSSGLYTNNANIAQPGWVAKSVFQASNHSPFQLSPVNISYPDTGLAGFYLSAEGSKIYPYLKAAVKGLKDLGNKPLDEDTLQIAKRTVGLQSQIQAQNTEELALDQAVQILAKGAAQGPHDMVQVIKQVSADDVKKAAAQLCNKLSVSAYGKVHQIPYADEL